MYKWLLISLLLTSCAKEVPPKIIYEKLDIEHPVLPVTPTKCPKSNYVLIEYKGTSMVAQEIKDKLDSIVCDRDKLRYSQELVNIIHYYEKVTTK